MEEGSIIIDVQLAHGDFDKELEATNKSIDKVIKKLKQKQKLEKAQNKDKKGGMFSGLFGGKGKGGSNDPKGMFKTLAKYAIGLDGLLNYYEHDDSQLLEDMTQQFVHHMDFPARLARPYCVQGSQQLLNSVATDMHLGITATAPGFYAPQGRHIRIAPVVKDLNEKLAQFEWNGLHVTNLEMETSAIYGLSTLMGHNALTVCLIIANRADGTFINDYHTLMYQAIEKVMSRL